MTGEIVKKFGQKGFGFILADGGKEIFFHVSNCTTRFDDLNEGDSVEFETENSPKGLRAIRVKAV